MLWIRNIRDFVTLHIILQEHLSRTPSSQQYCPLSLRILRYRDFYFSTPCHRLTDKGDITLLDILTSAKSDELSILSTRTKVYIDSLLVLAFPVNAACILKYFSLFLISTEILKRKKGKSTLGDNFLSVTAYWVF